MAARLRHGLGCRGFSALSGSSEIALGVLVSWVEFNRTAEVSDGLSLRAA